MNCNEIQHQLGTYLDDELPAGIRNEVAEHLGECTRCSDELNRLRSLLSHLGTSEKTFVPDTLWTVIAHRLDTESILPVPGDSRHAWRGRVPWAAAAVLTIGIGLGTFGVMSPSSQAQPALDFSVLLDALPLDAHKAFRKFLLLYEGRACTPLEARREADALSFDVPQELPGGFVLEQVYLLRFGDDPGIAASYDRNGEFLAAIFHKPVTAEQIGTHQDHSCVVGKHRGHKVEVGEWTLVHLTDPTTCHCVLSRLDEESELPAVMAAVAGPLLSSGHLQSEQSTQP